MSHIKPTREIVAARHAVIYQLFLRAFTPQGTLNAASELLPRVAELGADIIYLCPVCAHDDDDDRAFWSERQKKSGCDNPKNPYRMKDYFHVDPEYGTDADLSAFIRRAHALGLKVMLDLVYLHCGPKAVFMNEHPDFVKREPDGSFLNGAWCFPLLNFDNPALRNYLLENMLYYIREFDVDGYRCDVGDGIPLDFWEEARTLMSGVKPGLIMLNEGNSPAALMNAFDMNYGFHWWFNALKPVMLGEKPASLLADVWTSDHDALPSGGLLTRHLDNHDIANDDYETRMERTLDRRLIEAALIVNFTLDGVPMLYNGNEIGDGNRHSIFANSTHGRGLTIDWAQALTARGKERFEMVSALCAMRHGYEELTGGETEILQTTSPEAVFAFRRYTDQGSIITAVNFSSKPVVCTLSRPIDAANMELLLMSGAHIAPASGGATLEFLPYGAMIVRE